MICLYDYRSSRLIQFVIIPTWLLLLTNAKILESDLLAISADDAIPKPQSSLTSVSLVIPKHNRKTNADKPIVKSTTIVNLNSGSNHNTSQKGNESLRTLLNDASDPYFNFKPFVFPKNEDSIISPPKTTTTTTTTTTNSSGNLRSMNYAAEDKTATQAAIRKRGVWQRISVGHYQSSPYSSHRDSGADRAGIGVGSGHLNSGYFTLYDNQAYGDEGQHPDYVPLNSPYEEHEMHGTGYGYGGGGNWDERVPFDVYNIKDHYRGSGGDYAYIYPNVKEPLTAATPSVPSTSAAPSTTKKPQTDLLHKRLLTKSFLIPLASAAILGITAALVSNPLLLQLGTVSSVGPSLVGKRKRRRRSNIIKIPIPSDKYQHLSNFNNLT